MWKTFEKRPETFEFLEWDGTQESVAALKERTRGNGLFVAVEEGTRDLILSVPGGVPHRVGIGKFVKFQRDPIAIAVYIAEELAEELREVPSSE